MNSSNSSGKLYFIDRETGEMREEKVFGASLLKRLYGSKRLNRFFCQCVSRFSLFSRLYGLWQRGFWTRSQIPSFIEKFQVDQSEFASHSFSSFNDFFTRKLQKQARPIADTDAVIPADGRYLFFERISRNASFFVKGQPFSLSKLLASESIAEKYHGGTMVVARLCPSDYHRFHFPLDCTPGPTYSLNGPLFSVNPWALEKRLSILWENKRTLCTLQSSLFGAVLFMEVGATNVGSIHQSYLPGEHYEKGEEKGFFSFGGSTLILLFPPKTLQIARDLKRKDGLEIYCKMGQPLGRSLIKKTIA